MGAWTFLSALTLLVSFASACWVWLLLKRSASWTHSHHIFLGLLLCVSCLLPPGAAAVLFVSGLVLHKGFAHANRLKIRLTGMPLSAVDITFAIQHPSVLPHLVRIPRWVFGALVLASGAGIGTIAWVVFRSLEASPAFENVIRLAGAAVLAVYVPRVVSAFVRDVDIHLQTSETEPWGTGDTATWMPGFLARLSEHLGWAGFLAHSASYLREFSPAILRGRSAAGKEWRLDERELKAAVGVRTSPRQPPDIVVLQLESAFNPNWGFELAAPFRSPLFERTPLSTLVSPLRVNVVGGGSWVSEFECLTGLDVRLFGHQGYYTHRYLPPLIKEAFPAYLRRRGSYKTIAFYSAGDNFYNSRDAYLKYGFDEFLDPRSLGLAEWDIKDSDLAASMVRRLEESDPGRPFFAYAVTNGAHSPFELIDGREADVSFAAPADAAMSNELQKYCSLLNDSALAIERVTAYLFERQRRSNRPFILLFYGDHQPWKLTSRWFDSCRTNAPKNQTFVHLIDSESNALSLTGEIPVTLLSSLLSALVFENPQDWYMPINIALHTRLGGSAFSSLGRRRRVINLDSIYKDPVATSRPGEPGEVSELEQMAIQSILRSGVLEFRS